MQGFKSFARRTELPLENAMNVVVGPNGSGKSARWDTEVILADGDKRPIGEIVEESLNKSAKTEKLSDGILTRENPLKIRVLSVNPISMQLEEAKISAFMKRDGEKCLYTIKTDSGREVTTTSCHPVMIYRDGIVVSEVVKNLNEGDMIATPNKINLISVNKFSSRGIFDSKKLNSLAFAKFLGYIVGDGHIVKNTRIDFVNSDGDVLNDYENLTNSLGFSEIIAPGKNAIARSVDIYSKDLAKSLMDILDNKHLEYRKHIPKEILFGEKKNLSLFLSALFDCKATVKTDSQIIECVTLSNELANDIITALLRFGIIARKVSEVKFTSNKLLKRKKEHYSVIIGGIENLSKLNSSLDLVCSHKKELLSRLVRSKPSSNGDILPPESALQVREIFSMAGISTKSLRKKYPFLVDHNEKKYSLYRENLREIIPIIEKRLNFLRENQRVIKGDLKKSATPDSKTKGSSKTKSSDLKNFYGFVNQASDERIAKVELSLASLKHLAYSDIFWDKISEIREVKGDKYVYDIEVEKNHNFLANNIFVHNSNITDALCFVLGRMGTKSIRAAKASNLLFSGNKQFKGSNEAVVELIFDNTDRGMPIDQNEISIKRIVRKNGLSIYKINNETKTRQELIELLAQAGIDPNGFNIVLQGEIAAMIKMSPDERRKIIEEVAGISIYETRKEKSLRELEKTEEKLKETSAILREKNNYLKNLEKDRQDALNYKKIELSINQCKAGILSRDIKDREKEIQDLEKQKSENNSRISALREKVNKIRGDISSCEEKIREITKRIESSTSGEQEALHKEISDLKAHLAGQNVRKENYENRLMQNKAKIDNLSVKISETEKEIDLILKQSPEIKKQKELQKEIESKINDLEKQRRHFYSLKSEISTLESKKEEKQKSILQYERDLDFIDKTISQVFQELKHAKSLEKVEEIRSETSQSITRLEISVKEIESNILNLERKGAVLEQTIERESKLLKDIVKIQECPLCRSKITEEHRKDVIASAREKVSTSEKILVENSKTKKELEKALEKSLEQISLQGIKLREIGLESMKIKSCEEKKEQMKNLISLKDESKSILDGINKRLENLFKEFEKIKNVEEKYDDARLSLKELSLVDQDLDSETSSKQRDIERMKVEIKSAERDSEDSKKELNKILDNINEHSRILLKKEKQEQELYEKFQKSYNERNEIQDRQKALETNLIGLQHDIRSEDENNYTIKLREAEINAKLESLNFEFQEFKDVEIMPGSRESLANRLGSLQIKLGQLGSINMRALETYDQVKQVCDSIQEKVDIILKEKEKIMQIIKEIDKKKKKSFMTTLEEVNKLFTRNFTQVSRKGEVFLDLENKEDPFSAGLDIVVRVGRGKYFDIASLSGGEKTMVALSLIFAIQEYKPYCFYIFDEIDAALDKHNSELLAGLIKRYMVSGQYIIVTHNDALIEAAPVLFGVTMQDGISKIVSQRL